MAGSRSLTRAHTHRAERFQNFEANQRRTKPGNLVGAAAPVPGTPAKSCASGSTNQGQTNCGRARDKPPGWVLWQQARPVCAQKRSYDRHNNGPAVSAARPRPAICTAPARGAPNCARICRTIPLTAGVQRMPTLLRRCATPRLSGDATAAFGGMKKRVCHYAATLIVGSQAMQLLGVKRF